MTPFAIFAFVLTFGYVIYFAIMITLDLTAKPADGQKNEEEDIYVVTYTDSVSDDGLRIINPTSTGLPSQDTEEAPADPEPAPGAKEKVTSEELNEENEYGMEDIEPEAQHSMYAEELYSFLNEKHKNSRIIKKENVRDHL